MKKFEYSVADSDRWPDLEDIEGEVEHITAEYACQEALDEHCGNCAENPENLKGARIAIREVGTDNWEYFEVSDIDYSVDYSVDSIEPPKEPEHQVRMA